MTTAELRDLLARATTGKWETAERRWMVVSGERLISDCIGDTDTGLAEASANAALIALAPTLAAELIEARAERDEVRTILAGTDIGSLPDDYPLARLANDRMGDLVKLASPHVGTDGKVNSLRVNADRLYEIAQAAVALTAERDALREALYSTQSQMLSSEQKRVEEITALREALIDTRPLVKVEVEAAKQIGLLGLAQRNEGLLNKIDAALGEPR
jgi:hypothetical protein